MPQKYISISQPTERYDFALANLADTQTATAVPIIFVPIAGYLLPTDGNIVGYAALLSAAFSAGTATISIAINGTAKATVNIGVAATTKYSARFPLPALPFKAGDVLTVTYTTNASAAPTTNDLVASVFVMLDGYSY